MSALQQSGIEGFKTIAPTISLYRPENEHAGTEKSPSLIVFCTFMGAALKNIAKYTQGYQELFPDSAILLVQSSMKDTFASGLCPARIYNLNAGIAAGKNRRLMSSPCGERAS